MMYNALRFTSAAKSCLSTALLALSAMSAAAPDEGTLFDYQLGAEYAVKPTDIIRTSSLSKSIFLLKTSDIFPDHRDQIEFDMTPLSHTVYSITSISNFETPEAAKDFFYQYKDYFDAKYPNGKTKTADFFDKQASYALGDRTFGLHLVLQVNAPDNILRRLLLDRYVDRALRIEKPKVNFEQIDQAGMETSGLEGNHQVYMILRYHPQSDEYGDMLFQSTTEYNQQRVSDLREAGLVEP